MEKATVTTNIEPLVQEIVKMAKVDKSNPNAVALEFGWETYEVLRDVRDQQINQEKGIDTFISICRRVLGEVEDLSEITALVQLMIFDAKLRLPSTEEIEASLLDTIKKLEVSVPALPKGTRRVLCQSLLYLCKAAFYKKYGPFKLEVEVHTKAAKRAEALNDKPGAAICRFMEAFCLLKQVLYLDKSEEELEALFWQLEAKFVELITATQGTEYEAMWVKYTAPYYMIQACICLNKLNEKSGLGDKLAGWIKTVIDSTEGKDGDLAIVAQFVKAVKMFCNGGSDADEALYNVTEGVDKETKALALLMLVRKSAVGREWNDVTDLVNRMPVSEAEHVRAIANKILAGREEALVEISS